MSVFRKIAACSINASRLVGIYIFHDRVVDVRQPGVVTDRGQTSEDEVEHLETEERQQIDRTTLQSPVDQQHGDQDQAEDQRQRKVRVPWKENEVDGFGQTACLSRRHD